MQFFNKSKEVGFTVKEAEVLRRLALQHGIGGDPASVFSSREQLDMCIRLLIQETRASGKGDERETQEFLSKLYDHRQKIEIDGPMDKVGISNTNQIKNGQVFRILVAEIGFFKSQLVKNAGGYMTISRPVSRENVSVKAWQGEKISVYFWREDDAGYVFETEVKDEVYSLGILSLKIAHCFSLTRVQKRRSVRTRMGVPAFLYLVGEAEPFHKIESSPGLKCMLEDLSDTGFAVTVGGKAADGLHVKVQFELNHIAVCVSGTVRSAVFREETDRSILHVEADPLPTEVRNLILGKVFGTLDESDGSDLPFQVLDDVATTAFYPNGTSDFAEVDSLTSGEKAGDSDDS